MGHSPERIQAVRRSRLEESLSIDELAQRYGIARSTVQRWVSDLPRAGPRGGSGLDRRSRRRGNARMRQNREEMRRRAYVQGLETYLFLREAPGFREFIATCLAAGRGLTGSAIRIALPHPDLLANAARWLRLLAANRLRYRLRIPHRADPVPCREAWAERLGVPVDEIEVSATRVGHSKVASGMGTMAVTVNDTLLRCELEACAECLRAEWSGQGA